MIRARKTYNSCSELPLYNFIKIVCKDDLTWLYAEKKSLLNKNVDLQPVWDQIFSEYCELAKNPKSKQVFELVKELTLLDSKIKLVKNIVEFLRVEINDDLITILKSMGFLYKFQPNTIEKDLNLTLSSAKRFEIRKKEAEQDYKALQTDEKNATEKDFEFLIAQISRFMQFKIDKKTTSVSEYLNYLESFNIANTSKNGK